MFKLTKRATKDYLPQYETSQSAGCDVKAFTDSDYVEILPFKTFLFSTGLMCEFCDDVEAQIRTRSSMAFNKGLIVLNSPATIDPDYKGELKILIMNVFNNAAVVKKGDRIAQIVFNKIYRPSSIFIKNIERSCGFGSTGR